MNEEELQKIKDKLKRLKDERRAASLRANLRRRKPKPTEKK